MRRALPLTLFVVAGFLALASGVADAQLPIPTKCGSLKLSHDAVPDLAAGAKGVVTFTVQNVPASSAPAGPDIAGTLAVSIVESGWSANPATQSFVAPYGGSAKVSFNVTAASAKGASGILNAKIDDGQCIVNGQGLPGSPLSTVDTVTDSAPLQTAAASGFGFDLAALQNIPPLFFVGALAILVIIVGAFLASRRRGAGFDVSTPEPEKRLRAGRGASFPIEVKNRGRAPDAAKFDVGDVPAGWSAFMALPELMLAAGESRTLWLMIRAPAGADAGSATVVTLSVRSKEHARYHGTVAVRAVVAPEDVVVTESGSEATRVG